MTERQRSVHGWHTGAIHIIVNLKHITMICSTTRAICHLIVKSMVFIVRENVPETFLIQNRMLE